jgi:hypothetical protein
MSQLRTFSYGGGVQSTAALVLAAQGKIDFPVFLFANVGDDSEHPDTLRYVREVAMPYAAAQGIELVELVKRMQRGARKGEVETLYGRLTREDSRSIPIPLRMSGSGAPGNRACTTDFKVRLIAGALRKMGANAQSPAHVGLGISIDEFQRMSHDDPNFPHIHKVYPLIDLRLSRQDCHNIIAAADLPIPPKSSCWFCPYHRIPAWQKLKRETPELFDRAVALERLMNERRATLGKDQVWLTDKLRPIDTVIGDQSDMFDDLEDACESGFCMV